MAYGVDAPFGLQPRSYVNGNVWTGQVTEYLINGSLSGAAASYASSIFMGDIVTLAVDGTINKVTGTDNHASIGVFWGCKYYDTTNTLVFSKNWTASTPTFNNTNPICYVVDDPNVLFSAQVKGTGNVTKNVNTINIGLNVNGTYESDLNYNYLIHLGSAPGGSTISGNSTTYVDLATQSTTATYQVKLIQLEKYPGNNFGVQFNNGLFLINNHVYKGGTGTVGV
jgi:hypothetical protein